MSRSTYRISARVPDSPQEEARLARRVRLLALAGALDDLGLRARLAEYVLKPTLLRCWNPDMMSQTLLVVCERSKTTGRWEFRHHPGNRTFADAENVTEPAHAREAAERLAPTLINP